MARLYRADHVGSLLRPQELLAARSDPRVTPEQLTAIEDRHILEVFKRQKDAGLEIFTDGELRRTGFMGDFYESVEGLNPEYELDRSWKGAPTGVAAASGVGAPGGRSSRRSGRPSASRSTKSISSSGTRPATSR
jgi:methionine synthase II (cobalamin-independent)